MKFPDMSFYFRCVSLGIICVVVSACSAESVPATTSPTENIAQHSAPAVDTKRQEASQVDATEATDMAVPAQAFLRAILSLNQNMTGGGNLNFHMPAIWMFSPQGDLARIVQDESELAAFQADFSAIDPQAPNITCQSIEQAVSNITDGTWNMGCADGKWIALLLNTPRECTRVCMAYKNALAQVEQDHQAALQVSTLLVDFGA